MRSTLCLLETAAFFLIACQFWAPTCAAQSTESVQTTITDLKAWLAKSKSGPDWNRYLNLPALEAQLAKGDSADPKALSASLRSLEGNAPGLELPRFARLREALRTLVEERTAPKPAELPAVVLQAENDFHAVDAAQVARSKAVLEKAIARMDSYLRRNGANGQAWRGYLRLDDLAAQLKSDQPDVSVLESAYSRLTADEVGLELPVFFDLADAIENYRYDLLASREDARGQYSEQLKGLSEQLKKYADDHSEESAWEVGRHLGWLQNMRQAPTLVRNVRRHNMQPNLEVWASARLVAAGIQQSIDEVTEVRDYILGTAIHGTGRTVGKVDAQLVPNNQRAMLETFLTGQARTNTVGYNGPATICSLGTTDIKGRKRIVIDSNGFSSYPAGANAKTSTQITGVGAKRRIVQRIATKKVYQSKAEGEAIAASHAADRVRKRLEAQVAEQLGKAQLNFNAKFRDPMRRRRALPDRLEFSTTKDALHVLGLQATRYQLASPTRPPQKTTENGDLTVVTHQTMANNLAMTLLSGVTWKEEDVQKAAIDLLGELPEELQSEPDKDPWSITFQKSRPVTVTLTENDVQIVVRGYKYTSGERNFRAMNVKATYKIETINGHVKLVRQGDLDIAPPGRTRLSGQDVALKTLLQRRFGKLFKPEFEGEGLVLPGAWRKAGIMEIQELQVRDGWVVAVWRATGEPAPPEKPKQAKQQVAAK